MVVEHALIVLAGQLYDIWKRPLKDINSIYPLDGN